MLELKKHQQEALDFLWSKKGAGLFYEMGLGKTLIMLEHLRRRSEASAEASAEAYAENFPVLIVCPLSAVSVWQREVIKFKYPFRVKQLVGTYKERVQALQDPSEIYVVNYEGLRILKLHLYEKKFGTVIFDESHRIKERSAQQTQAALGISQRTPNRYVLTGTPVARSPEDVWTQCEVVAPGALGNFYAFRNRYIDFKKMVIRVNGGSREISKAYRFKNLEELQKRLGEFTLRRTKAECIDLPEKIYKLIPCHLGKEQQQHYNSLRQSLATMLEDKQLRLTSMTAVIRKLQQVCQGFIYDEDGKASHFDNVKLKMLKDILEDLPNEKVIVFTWFQADLDVVERELSKTRKVIRYEGTTAERAEAEKYFQESNPEEDGGAIFLANIEVAKESITLTSAASVIYYGNSWNYASRCQSEDRAHRIGQRRTVVYYDLICPGTIDEVIYDNLKKKGETADKITGDTVRMAYAVLGLEAA